MVIHAMNNFYSAGDDYVPQGQEVHFVLEHGRGEGGGLLLHGGDVGRRLDAWITATPSYAAITAVFHHQLNSIPYSSTRKRYR